MDSASLIALIIGVLVSAVGFFLTRAIGRVDASREEIWSLRETIGQMKAVNEAQWRKLDRMESELSEAARTIEVLKDRHERGGEAA